MPSENALTSGEPALARPTVSGIAAGEQVLADVPLLSRQPGTSPDLVLRWNDMPRRPRAVDLVLHLHGYATTGARMSLAVEKLPISGLDFGDPDQPPGSTAQRNRPTLLVLPRGRFFGGRTGYGYDFPILLEPPGTTRLVRLARSLFRAATGLAPTATGRRVLTAHSGGGAALMGVARQFQPHEIHVFDGLYSPAPLLIDWAAQAIRDDAAALRASRGMAAGRYMERWGRALRVLYVAGTGTEKASLELRDAVAHALAEAGAEGAALASWYRVEAAAAEHLTMPRVYGWRLLADAAVG